MKSLCKKYVRTSMKVRDAYSCAYIEIHDWWIMDVLDIHMYNTHVPTYTVGVYLSACVQLCKFGQCICSVKTYILRYMENSGDIQIQFDKLHYVLWLISEVRGNDRITKWPFQKYPILELSNVCTDWFRGDKSNREDAKLNKLMIIRHLFNENDAKIECNVTNSWRNPQTLSWCHKIKIATCWSLIVYNHFKALINRISTPTWNLST